MNDPAFLFYPGDYLRDTQCLSETVQVAYDRIMCEHMRNICISQAQLNFFTKKLSADEIEELKMVLTEVDVGFQIKWVAESIVKRKAYSESRRTNRKKKDPENLNNISKTYDKHMENEIENENKDDIKKGKEGMGEKPISNSGIPPFSEFSLYAKENEPMVNMQALKNKYDAWVVNDWKNGNDRQIKNWKSSLLQTLIYIEKNQNEQNTSNRNR